MKLTTPTVSVILPVYNAEKYIAHAIESILKQTYSDFEFIIIDDGSTDNSYSIIQEYTPTDSRIISFSRPNKGLVYTLNEGLSIARGEFIARMDADDVSEPSRLEQQVNYLRKNRDVVLLGVKVFSSYILPMRFVSRTGKRYCTWDLILKNRIGHPGVMFRSDIVNVNKLRYRQNYNFSEDFKLWNEMVSFGYADIIPKRLLFYRKHNESITHNNVKKQLLIDRKITSEAIKDRLGVDIFPDTKISQREWFFTVCKGVFYSSQYKKLKKIDKIAIHQSFQDYGASLGINFLMDYIRMTGLLKLFLSGRYLPSIIYRTLKNTVQKSPRAEI